MKIHLAWIRVTAAAAIVAGMGVHPAAAQYAPYRPIQPQPAAPQQAPAAAPATQYVANRAPAAYPPPIYPQTQPTARYQAPVTPVAPYQAPATAYRQPVAPYPQTAMAHYPATYGTTPYVAQSQQPTEVMPAPQQQATGGEAPPATAMPADPAASGYPNAGTNGGYSAGSYYGAGGSGACGTYPEMSGCMDDCGNDNIWFGGVYFLYMDRADNKDVRLAVEVDHAVAPNPYYPLKSTTVVSTTNVDYDWRWGAEVRFGCTFQIGEDNTCNSCSSGYGYPGCGCNTGCNTCAPSCPPTTFAWEFVWWGLDNDPQAYVFEDQVNTRVYGMKNFAGLDYDRDAGGVYGYRPVNEYYDYQLPIPTPPGAPPAGYVAVLAQRVWSDFKMQNLEVNVIRFPICDTCGNGCGGGCANDACGCNSNYTGCNSCNSCGCEEKCWTSNFSAYGSCGVRYFRIDDDFAYDTEFAEYDGAAYDQGSYNGFSYDNSNELCYDVQVENNLIGPQVGWTTNYCVNCRWNFFWNSTFGVFDNHMTNYQRMWTGGDGSIVFSGTGQEFNVRSSKDDIAFLGELRVGGSYDFSCHCRGVLAYRAVALSGIATSIGQIPTQFSSYNDVAQINSDNSMIIHGIQSGVEFRY